MIRLSQRALADLPHSVRRPEVNRAALHTGIVHLGLGAFHRAHQAVYTDTVLKSDPRWGICGVSLKTPRVSEIGADKIEIASYQLGSVQAGDLKRKPQ